MKQILKKIITPLILAALMFVVTLVPASAVFAEDADCSGAADMTACESAAAREQSLCDGAAAAGVQNCGDYDESSTAFKDLIGTIVDILSIIVGAVSVIMIIIGGFRYVVSAGDSNAMSGAKNTILYAIVGLVIVLFAQIIVAFVIDRATAPPAEESFNAMRTNA